MGAVLPYGSEPAQHSTRIPYGNAVRGNGAGNHAAGADRGVLSNLDTRQDGHRRADADVATDADRSGVLQPRGADDRIDGMAGGGDHDVGGDENIVPDLDPRTVEDDEVVIRI